jgi:hypothetical protein
MAEPKTPRPSAPPSPKAPVNEPSTPPKDDDPGKTPPMTEPVPKAPPPEEPPPEPGSPPPMIQDPPAPDANPIDPRVFGALAEVVGLGQLAVDPPRPEAFFEE